MTREEIDFQIKLENIIKHINRTLRDNKKVKDWTFGFMTNKTEFLSVRIDYIGNMHSRNVFDKIQIENSSLETLEEYFDYILKGHLIEVNKLIEVNE